MLGLGSLALAVIPLAVVLGQPDAAGNNNLEAFSKSYLSLYIYVNVYIPIYLYFYICIYICIYVYLVSFSGLFTIWGFKVRDATIARI